MVVVGAPWDGGTSHRPGTRFGPQAIRQTDYLPHDGSRPHLALRVDALQDLRVVDAGDVEMPPGEQERSRQNLEEAVYAVASQGTIPLVLGGDHSIALPDATGVARHLGFGRVSMIHFDAHADTGDIEFGSLYGHGQPMRRLIESGALRGDRFLQIGLRGYWPGPETLGWMAEQDMRSFEMTEIGKRGLTACLDEAFEIALDDCDAVFLSVDIDVCDPGHAPGTGTPEPGGLSARELLDAVRRICLRAPGRRHRRGRGVAALRPRRDHRVPRQPGLPRGAVRAGRAQGRDQPRPGRAAAGGPMSDRLPRRAPSSTGTGTSARADVLVDGGRIVEVGHDLRGDDDRRRGLLAPGFTDAHVHPIQGGLERLRCDLSEHDTREEYLAAIRAYADATPTSSGSSAAAGRCRRSPAARRSPPTSTRWCRTGRCSCPTATTTAPGSTAARWRSPASPPTRRTRRTAGSSATPTAARAARCTRARPRWSPATCPAPPAPTTAPRCWPARPTCTRSASPAGRTRSSAPTPAWTTPRSTYVEAAASGELRSHVVGALWWDRRQGVEQVADLVGRRDALTGGRFRATTVKIMQDGVAENGTAAMLEPYLDGCGQATDNRGHSFVEAQALKEAVRALDAAGFQVHVHAIGDRAARETLDAMDGTDPACATRSRTSS